MLASSVLPKCLCVDHIIYKEKRTHLFSFFVAVICAYLSAFIGRKVGTRYPNLSLLNVEKGEEAKKSLFLCGLIENRTGFPWEKHVR